MIHTENGRVVNDNGMVAIRHFPAMPTTAQAPGQMYYFEVRNCISLVWVQPHHVDYLLSIRRRCCGGNDTIPFRLASEAAAKIWSNMDVR